MYCLIRSVLETVSCGFGHNSWRAFKFAAKVITKERLAMVLALLIGLGLGTLWVILYLMGNGTNSLANKEAAQQVRIRVDGVHTRMLLNDNLAEDAKRVAFQFRLYLLNITSALINTLNSPTLLAFKKELEKNFTDDEYDYDRLGEIIFGYALAALEIRKPKITGKVLAKFLNSLQLSKEVSSNIMKSYKYASNDFDRLGDEGYISFAPGLITSYLFDDQSVITNDTSSRGDPVVNIEMLRATLYKTMDLQESTGLPEEIKALLAEK